MEVMTTISISQELKQKIKEFGNKGDSYDTILKQWYEYVEEKQLENILFSKENTVTVKEALEEAKEKWSN